MSNFSVFSFLETLDLLFSFCKFFLLKRNLKRQHVGFTIANLYALRIQFCEFLIWHLILRTRVRTSLAGI